MNRKLLNLIHTRRGLALVSVLAMVTLATVIVLALFSVSDNEFKASKVYAGGNAARQLADTAVNVVIGQIRSATYDSTKPAELRIWASQPGGVRVYGPDGSFSKGYKLYSDEAMVVETAGSAGEAAVATDVPSSNWDKSPDRYVDLNEPVVRAEGGGITRLFYPIADPRAAYDDPSTAQVVEKVEGFSYKATSPAGSGGSIAGVVEPGSVKPAELRLPMPVEWLYVLKDGSVGTVGDNGNWSKGTAPDDDNPIIGRVAFWTDDESCRVNINTASEPGYWAVPTFFHDRDKGWSDSPPVVNEYQRFPGHPATVALSAILYPSATSTPKFVDAYPNAGLVATGAPASATALAIKERIYQIIPKINAGGTLDGTLAFAGEGNPQDTVDESKTATGVDLMTSRAERLYASLDELMFAETMKNNRRDENDFTVGGTTLLQAGTLEKTRFFMTAHSKSPELNLFGRPRVAMWPIPDASLGDQFRTGYDAAIAATATLSNSSTSANTYYFSRKDADLALVDTGIDARGEQGLLRNNNLLKYLDFLMKKTFPGGDSFANKYGGTPNADYRQILVEIFDYIRCTNLYDSFLAPKFTPDKIGTEMDYREGTGATTPMSLAEAMIWKEIPKAGDFRTYTEPRFKVEKTRWYPTGSVKEGDTVDEIVASGVYPGHGQVTPAEWQIDGQTYKGFGRFPTISEVGLQFICTADGQMRDKTGAWDLGSYVVVDDSGTETRSGGRTAEKINPTIENPQDPGNPGYRVAEMTTDDTTGEEVHAYWYSNYPPFPSKKTLESYGCDFSKSGSSTPGDPALHPGGRPENWNATLDRDVPLLQNEKRIQVCLLVEFFVPSVGWTKYAPEFTLVLEPNQLSAIKVKDSQGKMTPLFSTTDPKIIIRSNMSFISNRTDGLDQHYGIYPVGSTASPRAIIHGRQVKGVGQMPDDPSYNGNATADEHFGIGNFTLVSSFVTVRRDQSLTVEGSGAQGLSMKLYADHNWEGKDAVQTINVPIPNIDATSDVPTPELVRYSTQRLKWEDANGAIYTQRAVDACRWWAFNWGGALRRWTGAGEFSESGVVWGDAVKVANPADGDGVRTRGRFEGQSHGSVNIDDTAVNKIKGNVATGALLYGYTVGGGFNGVKSRSQDRSNIDLYKPASTANQMGQYGFYGSDTVRAVIPKYGDYRLVAAKKVVNTEMWAKHRLWDQPVFFAHNYSSFFSNTETGFDKGGDRDETSSSQYRLVTFKQTDSEKPLYDDYKVQFVPDMPATKEASDSATRYGDFDNGPGTCRDGAYINKPDEGNLSVVNMYFLKAERRVRNAYFQDQWMQLPATESFFTPNRMISSPGMFGSLPTGVFGSQSKLAKGSDSKTHGEPWRTLLFRPQLNHPGGPAHATGGVSPADHYIMDLFWMPVVEPYAISESWATAGKINMNFQIVPFSYITRATGMYAAMKGELVTAIPTTDARIRNVTQRSGGAQEKSYKEYMDVTEYPPLFFSETGGPRSNPGKFWHRYINLEATTTIMKRRMDIRDAADDPLKKGLFRTASQICEIPLVPVTVAGTSNPGDLNDYENGMANFWRENQLTGDNTRERPYANLYQKLTTRSNTFRVYYRAQALKKARSLGATKVSTVTTGGQSADSVIAEYRGSALVERYLDMSANLPNYGDGSDPFAGSKTSLDAFYRYRVLESKQFSP